MTYKNKDEILRFLSTHTYKETSETFKISEMTLARWKKTNISLTKPTHITNISLTKVMESVKKLVSYQNPTIKRHAKIIEAGINDIFKS